MFFEKKNWSKDEQLNITIKRLTESDFGKNYINRLYMIPEEVSPYSYFVLFFDGDILPSAEESCLFCKTANDIVREAAFNDDFKECEIFPVNSPDYEEWKDKVVLVWER